jgi:APA family basic amino acid/polyamine antiporter
LKFIPLIIISTIGLFYIDWSMLQPFNRTDGSILAAIVTTMALAVFSFLGVETASVAAGKVRNPTRNVPRASLLGTLAAAVVYILSTLVIFGTVPNSELQDPNAQPFVQSFNAMFGGSWAGYAVAIAAIISGFGALNGWTMICAEMPLAAAREGLFPRRFAAMSRRGVPAFGIISSTVLASILMVFAYMGQEGAGVFNVMILLSGLTAAVPYLFSAFALMRWSARPGERRPGANWKWEGAIATVGMGFSALIIYGSFTDAGTRVQLAIMTIVVFVIGLVMYMFMRRHFVEGAPPIDAQGNQEVTP